MRFSSARRHLGACVAACVLTGGFAFLPPQRDAWAAPGDHKFVTLRGRVADAAGSPLGDVRVEAMGTREGIALTNHDGRFNLTLDLGTLLELQRRPVSLSVKAWRAGHRIRVAGGSPELVLELRLGHESGAPVLQARSNFGIIADVLLEALAPAGDRTAVIRVSFTAEPGAGRDSSATLPEGYRSVPIAEPWAVSAAPAPPPPAREEPKRPVVRDESRPPAVPAPAAPGAARARVDQPPAPPAARATPGRVKRETERRKDAAARVDPQARPPFRITAVPSPVRLTHADSLRLAREAQQRAGIAAAQAQRDSAWRIQRVQALARKAVIDSLRANREAAEDSARRARFGLPPRPTAPAVAAKPAPKPPVAKQKPARSTEGPAPRKTSGPSPARAEWQPYAPTVGTPPATSGLRRIEPRADAFPVPYSDADARARLEADTCACVVRGTVEIEFHRLLTSPMRVEVSVRELPSLRDTIELFMGSPRAFEMTRVPCGRWSLALRPFSERPFGVTTPEEVGPFDCRQRALRQVRIVIVPLRSSR